MTETSLKALMRLFALVAQVHPQNLFNEIKGIIETFVKLHVRNEGVKQYIIMFEFYHNSLREREVKTGEKQLSLFSVKSIIICDEINKELDKKQKLSVLLSLIDILSLCETNTEEAEDFIKTIVLELHFEEKLLQTCLAFSLGNFGQIENQSNMIYIHNGKRKYNPDSKYIEKIYLKGVIAIIYIPSVNVFLLKHCEINDNLYYGSLPLELNHTYILQKGSTIINPLIGAINYSEIVRAYYHSRGDEHIQFQVEYASFSFKGSENGIKEFNLSESSGHLVGIMGGSGVGKSTLLNLLNGNIKPQSGKVLINGFDVHTEKNELKGIIGYIPQDDLLIDELTVFQNLYYSAKLCFDNYTESQLRKKVYRVLTELDLYEIRNLKVGNPLNKFISGGQRKRLNIALELIREPYVLFVDEPTSGLSSTDSDIVIDLLKEQTLKGKLVIVNIHQPSSDIYKTFDRLILMDKGGRIIYTGTPLDALVYLKSYNQLVNARDGECQCCGNINPEQALQIMEAKKVNEFGEYEHDRKVSAEDWYDSYKRNLEKDVNQAGKIKINLPKNEFKTPSKIKQLRIFSIRNILSKLADKQYLFINIVEAPVLAFILAWFTKYKAGISGDASAYVFSENINIPVYIFMCTIVALFIGMMVAAEEIIRDKKIIQREQFLDLSIFSYYNSKILVLILITFIQSLLFIGIGNSILRIKGMFLPYFLYFFITALFANLISLNISATLKSVVAIYILIPLMIVPQILFGGAMIPFDKLNSTFTNDKYVPLVGDVMASRWSYEALSVYQYMENDYKKNFYELELEESRVSFLMNYKLPELQLLVSQVEYNLKNNINRNQTRELLELLKTEITILESNFNKTDINVDMLQAESYNLSISKTINDFINSARQYYSRRLDKIVAKKDEKILELQEQVGGREKLLALMRENHNLRLEETVLNKSEKKKIQLINNNLIQKYEPIYLFPDNIYGRAHMFAPYKKIGKNYIETFWFNFIVLFLMLLFFYFTLITNFFPALSRKIKHIIENHTFKKVICRLQRIFKGSFELIDNPN